jgi:hypothetical protein
MRRRSIAGLKKPALISSPRCRMKNARYQDGGAGQRTRMCRACEEGIGVHAGALLAGKKTMLIAKRWIFE